MVGGYRGLQGFAEMCLWVYLSLRKKMTSKRQNVTHWYQTNFCFILKATRTYNQWRPSRRHIVFLCWLPSEVEPAKMSGKGWIGCMKTSCRCPTMWRRNTSSYKRPLTQSPARVCLSDVSTWNWNPHCHLVWPSFPGPLSTLFSSLVLIPRLPAPSPLFQLVIVIHLEGLMFSSPY